MSGTDQAGPQPQVLLDGRVLADHQVIARTSAAGARVTVASGLGPAPASLRVRRRPEPSGARGGPDGGSPGPVVAAVSLSSPSTIELPLGGPYCFELSPFGTETLVVASDVVVGDLWVLAGQSNMFGAGRLAEVEPSCPMVRVLDATGSWAVAEEPLHGCCPSPDPILEADLDGWVVTPAERDELRTAWQPRGAGLGLSFANALWHGAGVPLGLLPVAVGGSSMDEWSPERRDDPGSLYGCLLQRVATTGGRVAGVLWYQGESETTPERAADLPAKLACLVSSLRADLGRADLAFHQVQVGRFVHSVGPAEARAWSEVREVQRRGHELGVTSTATAVDLDLDDLIHLGTRGLRRLGRRLARLALGAPSLSVAEVAVGGPARTVVEVSYQGVSGSLRPDLQVIGFSVRDSDGNGIPIVFRAEVRPERLTVVVLHLVRPPRPGEALYYGFGADPVCNLTDAEDMAALAFGPWPLT